MKTIRHIKKDAGRAQRVLAKVRRKQLDLAMQGHVEASARYAHLACRVRRQVDSERGACACFAA